MAITTGSLFDRERLAIEEVINKDVEVILPSLDPAYRDTIVSNQEVFPAQELGRDWKALRIIRGTFAGVIDGGIMRNDFTLYGDTTNALGERMMTQNLTQTFPDPLDGPKPLSKRLGIPLQSLNTNLAMTWGEMLLEATPAYIGRVLAPVMEGFARNMSHQLCNLWYVSENNNYTLATMKAAGDLGTTVGAPGTVTFNTVELCPNRFWRGMRVDIYQVGTGIRANDSLLAEGSQTATSRRSLWVQTVDELKNKIVLITDQALTGGIYPGMTAITVATAGNKVTYANLKLGTGNFTGPAGVNAWLKSTGNLLGNQAISGESVDVDVHPEFKSLIPSAINGPLTEPLLISILRRFHSAKDRYGMDIDCLIASDGVWLEYFRQIIPTFYRDRGNSQPASIGTEGLKDGFSFTVDGRSYKGYTSTYVEDGTVYGIKKGGGNWERITPPWPDRAAPGDNVDSFVPFRFALPTLLNSGSTRALMYSTPVAAGPSQGRSLISEVVQMPGTIHMNLAPKQPAGIKLTGVSTFTFFP